MKQYIQKTLALLAICFCLFLKTQAINYYFSSSNGNDSYTTSQAHNPLTPWKTLTKLNTIMSTLQPGDSVLFKSGDTFYGSFTVTVSGNANSPIVFSSYGNGAKPIISGLTALTTWTAQGGNIWESDCPNCGNTVNMFIIDNKPYAMGRYPNITAPNKGYLIFEGITSSQITDNQLTSTPNWTNAEIVVRTSHWTLDRRTIQSHAGTTITCASPALTYSIFNNYGYFIQNHPQTLDTQGEWYYNPVSKKVLLYSNNPALSNINLSSTSILMTVYNANYITINNIEFTGANDQTFNIGLSKKISIKNCNVNFSGFDAISGFNLSNFTLENNFINNSNSIAVNLNYSKNTSIKNNVIKNTAVYPGMGRSSTGKYTGISLIGNNNIIENNSIDSTGYIPINFQGDTILIKNNFINNFCYVLDDGGGIYSWNSCPSNANGIYGATYISRKVDANIILNGIGATEGTSSSSIYKAASGIYLDDNTMGFQVTNNTTANCGLNGIFLHNAYTNVINKNTAFNNHIQLCFEGSGNCTTDTIKDNKTTNNIFFSKQPNQLVSRMFANSINNVSKYGMFDTNYYCRPINEEAIISYNNGNIYNSASLAQWQLTYNKDLNSNITPIQIPTYTLNSLIGTNKYSNGTFSANISGLYCWSSQTNCATSWDNSGVLDGGCLKHKFPQNLNNTSSALLVVGIGAIDSSKKYILRFSLKGLKNNKTVSVGLRKSLYPYNDISSYTDFKITTARTENEILFIPDSMESNASIQFKIDEGDSTIWIDNLELYEANVTMTNLDDYIRFEYNATQSPKTIPLSDQYIDVKNNFYSNSLTLQPFTSVILLKVPNTVGIKNNIVDQKSNITIYPNPTSNQLNFQSTNKDLSKILIYDLIGRCILEQTYSSQIDVSSLSNGVYIVKVLNKNEQLVGSNKIVIQK